MMREIFFLDSTDELFRKMEFIVEEIKILQDRCDKRIHLMQNAPINECLLCICEEERKTDMQKYQTLVEFYTNISNVLKNRGVIQ